MVCAYRQTMAGPQFRHLGEIRLIVDGSKVGFGHQLLLIAIAYRSRSIPLAWTWLKGGRGHSTAHKQMALLTYVHGLLPSQSKVLLVGDAEFGEVDVQKLLQKWHWKYVLRQKGRYLPKQMVSAPINAWIAW